MRYVREEDALASDRLHCEDERNRRKPSSEGESGHCGRQKYIFVYNNYLKKDTINEIYK